MSELLSAAQPATALQRAELYGNLQVAQLRDVEQGGEWIASRPAACVVPGAASLPLRHGRTTYWLLDDSPGEAEANDKDDRPVVVLINGISLWSFIYSKLAAALMETKRCKAVLGYDRYGRGTSDVAANGNSGEAVRHSPDLFAQQVDDLLVAVRLRSGKILKKEAEEERLVLVGASMGGMIATQYAAVTPSAIKRLVLIGPAGLRSPPRMNGPDLQFLRIPWLGHLAYLAIGEKEQLKHIKERQLRDDDPKLADQDPQLLADITSSLAWQVKCKPGFLWDIYRDLTQMPWGGMQDQAEAVGRHGYPVELIWGSEDVTIPISFAEMWQGRIPRAKLTTIDGAGHSPYLTSEHMDVLVDTILPPT